MKTIRDINIDNKNVIIRFDYNVPIKDGIILDDTRITKSLKTLNYCIERANKVIIISHLGRIKNEEDKKNNSLRIVCNHLKKIINKDIVFCTYEEDVKEVVNNNKIIMLENTRFFDLDNKKESNCDMTLATFYASLGDIFINDAFGVSHRKCASNYGISTLLPSVNGFLMEEEISNLDKLINDPERPFIVIMGGKKVSDKLKVIENLLTKCDKLLVGGALSYTFLKSIGYNIGNSFYEEDYLSYCKKLMDNYSDKIILTMDNYINKDTIKDINMMEYNDIGFDIGTKTIDLFKKNLKEAKTIFLNGPMGLFEDGYEYGTRELIKHLNSLNAYVVIGGGDSINAVNKYAKDNNFVISTGGGASLEYLEGTKLPGVIYE